MPWSNVGNLKGVAGAKGTKGDKGDQGLQGLRGTAGTPGGVWHVGAGVPPGGTGVDGDLYLDTTSDHVYNKASGTWHDIGSIQGTAGAGLTVQGSVTGASIGTGPTAGLGTGDAGKAWIISTAGTGGGVTWAIGHLAVWDGTGWHDAGQIQGPAGIQGPPGTKGADGAIGPSATFTMAGVALAPGAAPTLSGTGTGGDPYVLGVPQGTTGAAGPAGGIGPAGGAGPAGTRGSLWYTGAGAPAPQPGEAAGDHYLDLTSGDVYALS